MSPFVAYIGVNITNCSSVEQPCQWGFSVTERRGNTCTGIFAVKSTVNDYSIRLQQTCLKCLAYRSERNLPS